MTEYKCIFCQKPMNTQAHKGVGTCNYVDNCNHNGVIYFNDIYYVDDKLHSVIEKVWGREFITSYRSNYNETEIFFRYAPFKKGIFISGRIGFDHSAEEFNDKIEVYYNNYKILT